MVVVEGEPLRAPALSVKPAQLRLVDVKVRGVRAREVRRCWFRSTCFAGARFARVGLRLP
jgi:hypothetical protein